MRRLRSSSSALLLPGRASAFGDVAERATTEVELMAKGGGVLFVVAAVIGLVALLFPGGEGEDIVSALATSFAALGLGGVLWFYGARFNPLVFQVIVVLATTLASISAHYGGPEGWLNGFYYFWIALFVAYFFTVEWIVFQMALIGAEYGVVVLLNDWSHGALIWFLTMTTVWVMAALFAFLRRRLERALEAERAQVESLRELDQLRSDFMATVSHELRTPVSAVYGAVRTLRGLPLGAESQDELLAIADAEAARLADLTDAILQATAIERQMLELELSQVDVNEVAQRAVEAMRLSRAERTIEIKTAAESPQAQGDPKRLQQVLANLLDNALKYSPSDRPVELEVQANGKNVHLRVHDWGPGIPLEAQAQVFEKFHRLDAQMQEGVGGSGLGLYIVRGLVEAMAGKVWIETAPVGGTTMVVELAPWAGPEAGTPAPTSR